MYSHVMVGAKDLQASKRFYDALFAVLGQGEGMVGGDRVFWSGGGAGFGIVTPINGEAACHANGGTIGFAAPSTDAVDAWHAAGVSNGGTTCEDPPGIREGSFGKLYLAYLRDPSGNKLCAMHRLG